MKNQWYGDHRDIIKWGVLLHLARAHQLELVIQVAYLTPDDRVPRIDWELDKAEVTSEVVQHFRDIRHIKELARLARVQIEVFDNTFKANSREKYTAEVVNRVHALDGKATALLLDPDTGISKNRKSSAHVTPEEITAIWAALRPRDWLVLYQHASRERNWREKRRETFTTTACAGAQVIQFWSPDGARDVAFFAASRTS